MTSLHLKILDVWIILLFVSGFGSIVSDIILLYSIL